MPKISYTAYLGLSLAILAQFTLKMSFATKNHEEFIKNPYFKSSRSFKVIDVNSPKTLLPVVLVMISSMCVPISYCFYAIRTDSRK